MDRRHWPHSMIQRSSPFRKEEGEYSLKSFPPQAGQGFIRFLLSNEVKVIGLPLLIQIRINFINPFPARNDQNDSRYYHFELGTGHSSVF